MERPRPTATLRDRNRTAAARGGKGLVPRWLQGAGCKMQPDMRDECLSHKGYSSVTPRSAGQGFGWCPPHPKHGCRFLLRPHRGAPVVQPLNGVPTRGSACEPGELVRCGRCGCSVGSWRRASNPCRSRPARRLTEKAPLAKCGQAAGRPGGPGRYSAARGGILPCAMHQHPLAPLPHCRPAKPGTASGCPGQQQGRCAGQPHHRQQPHPRVRAPCSSGTAAVLPPRWRFLPVSPPPP